MDIRPGQSPGSIFGNAENNPLVQSFDEESPDSVLNPDGSVGYLAARLSKERGATAERLKTLTAMEQRGDIDSKEKGDLKDALLAQKSDLETALDRVANREAPFPTARSPPAARSLEHELQHMMSLDDVASTSFGGRNQTLASPRGASLLDNMRQPVSGYSFHDESVAQAAAIAAAEMRSSGGNLMGSYDGASSFLGARNSFQGRHSPPFGGGGVPRRLSAPGARAHRPSPPAEFAPFAALIDQADDMPGFEFEMENSLGTTPTPNVGSPIRPRAEVQRLRRQGSIADRARAAAPRPAPAPRPPPAPPVTSPGKHRGCSTTIDLKDLPPLDSFPTQEAPSYDSVINFNRTKGRGAPHSCVMCGKRGRPPTKGKDPPADDDRVVIPTQNKDVCKVCDTVTWKHNPTGAYFKWCKGCKRFHEIHAFAGKISASKCNGARARGRAYMRNYHAALED
mmetsp:Transcript_9742/g.28696  ORF Transcript_9742/g.28696 Transcript_9742/m.28696 type:complete len:453 (-) Transcript_9742:53-1411(-)